MKVLSISKWRSLIAGIAIVFACSHAATAQEFSLAMSAAPTSLDPQFYNNSPNIIVAQHMFEGLTKLDAESRTVPGLAESWRPVDNLTWEFKLRRGVKFHDGSELTAEDVAWSLARPATVLGSPGKFDLYTKSIASTKIVDPYTIRVITKDSTPLLPTDLVWISIVSKRATKDLTSEDFATGRGVVGTGPYKFHLYSRGDRIVMERNDAYWGKKPAWSTVTLRFIANDTTRLAALLAGDVQAIENVPTADLPKVRADNRLSFFSKVSHRLIYLYLDSVRERSPYVVDANGKQLDKNPLRDVRVRRALSMAINRDGIKEHVMEGLSAPTSNLVPITFGGYNPAIKDIKFDPEEAKKLLRQAGYPNGFFVTIHTPNNRYINDEKIAQTVAQMWSKIGVNTKVEGLPMSVYSSLASKELYSIGLFGIGAQTGEISLPLRAMIACPDAVNGMGGFNRGRYCNRQMDKVLLKAIHTMDNTERTKLLQEASAIALNDVAVIPIHNQVTTWAATKGLVFTPRTDELTLAYDFRPK